MLTFRFLGFEALYIILTSMHLSYFLVVVVSASLYSTLKEIQINCHRSHLKCGPKTSCLSLSDQSGEGLYMYWLISYLDYKLLKI